MSFQVNYDTISSEETKEENNLVDSSTNLEENKDKPSDKKKYIFDIRIEINMWSVIGLGFLYYYYK